MSERPSLSIIIPAYNEAARIGPSLEQILLYLEQTKISSEVIIVDDGSSDRTSQLVSQFIRRQQTESVDIKLFSNSGNRGKGYSVRRGVLQARGSIVFFTDADLSAPITELPKLIEPIGRGECEIAIGSRALDRRLIGQRQPPWRDYAGRLFNLLIRLLTGLSFKDTQCGFKAYGRESALTIFQKQKIDGFSFDVEVLYLAKRQGLRIKEIPVVWNHTAGSRVHLLRDSAKMFLEILQLRWDGWRGKYTEPG